MKRTLVTGCSSGIGKALALALLQDGWEVVGVSRQPPMLPSLVGFTWIHADLKTAWHLSLASWQFESGLDALIHCAAEQGPVGPLAETTPQAWADCIAVNLTGTFHVLQATLPALRLSRDARILLFSGGGAFNPRPGYSAYAASKAGVVAMAETLAAELAGTGVTINCVCPGYVPTPIHGLPDTLSPEMDRAVACVRHLLSPAARGLTGKSISAAHDAWPLINAGTVPFLNARPIWTRTRVRDGMQIGPDEEQRLWMHGEPELIGVGRD